MAAPVAATQHVSFTAFDIDLEKVDLPWSMPLAKRGERHRRQALRAIADAELAGIARQRFDRRGKSMQPVNDVELGLAVFASDETAHHGVARAQMRIKLRERRLRLYHDAAPAPLI